MPHSHVFFAATAAAATAAAVELAVFVAAVALVVFIAAPLALALAAPLIDTIIACIDFAVPAIVVVAFLIFVETKQYCSIGYEHQHYSRQSQGTFHLQ